MSTLTRARDIVLGLFPRNSTINILRVISSFSNWVFLFRVHLLLVFFQFSVALCSYCDVVGDQDNIIAGWRIIWRSLKFRHSFMSALQSISCYQQATSNSYLSGKWSATTNNHNKAPTTEKILTFSDLLKKFPFYVFSASASFFWPLNLNHPCHLPTKLIAIASTTYLTHNRTWREVVEDLAAVHKS